MSDKPFPKTLFVKIEDERGDAYFVAASAAIDLAVIGEKEKIATYTLVETGTIEGVASVKMESKR